MATDRRLVTEIRGLLDRLVASRKLTADSREIIYDEVGARAHKLPREGVVAAVEAAIGRSKARRREAVWIYTSLMDSPEVLERIEQWLHDPDCDWRQLVLQCVGNYRITAQTPALNEIMTNDPDMLCRRYAIEAAGTMRERVNLPTLLRLAEDHPRELKWPLIWALKNYSTPECQPALQRVFGDASDKEARVVAAWGLARLGDQAAYAFLKEMLYDPDQRGPNYFTPGVSLRAAQALCDVNGWPFEWNTAWVEKTRQRVI